MKGLALRPLLGRLLSATALPALIAALALCACGHAGAQATPLDLVIDNGYQWLAYVSPDLLGTEDFSAVNAPEANFVPYDLPMGGGDFVPALLSANGIANGNMHAWFRLHLTIPAEWATKYKGPLRLYGFNFNASDETFFNGVSIGKTGTNPPGQDTTGFVRNADTIREYTIPESLVNWTGDNVIVIHGYHDAGTGGFTRGHPKLVPLAGVEALPSIDLIKENGFQWLAYISPDLMGDEDFSPVNASEANFIPWDVTATNGNFTPALLDARGIPNGDMHVWLRLHVRLPAEWGTKYRGDLRLYGFNFNASDETFFNGTSIGSKGVNPPGQDRTGFTRDADTIRDYTIPANLVNWDGDNVIAIHGYHDGGTGGFTNNRPKLAPTVISSTTPTLQTGVKGTVTMDDQPAMAVNVAIKDANGAVVNVAPTNKAGEFSAALSPGSYVIEVQAGPEYGSGRTQVTVEAGKVTTVPPINLYKLPSLKLLKENGFQWLAYISPDIDYAASFADPKASEANFLPWDLTAGAGNFTASFLDVNGIPNGDMHAWLRVHVTLPADWGTKFRGPLKLYGFNFNASDETFFNGVSIGKTGVNPTGPGREGFIRDADTIRSYIIPAEAVNWTGDNVIAIHGFHDGGTGGFTNSTPILMPTMSSPAPVVVKGDLNGDGKVAIADTTIALKIAVGLLTASPAQLAAGDLNADGKITINEVTQILRAAVGLITL